MELAEGGGPPPVLVTVGDISCTSEWVITPSGNHPIKDVVWSVNDMSTTSRVIPVWAIILTIITFWFFLLGLLFLLVRETKTSGIVQVTVQGANFFHAARVAVASPAQVADVNARVGYARSLTAGAAA
jgi:hypothetical protein